MDYNNSTTSLYSNKEDEMDSSNNSNLGNNNNVNLNHNRNINSNQNGMSKAELRKSNKPIMEKRRRARINHCLNELKSLILEAMKKDPARHTKLEKADILEMTVKHLQSIQRQQFNLAIQTDPAVVHKFKTGFTECAEEVSRFLGQLEGIDNGTKQRLMQHLNNCSTRIEQIGTFSNFSSSYRQALNSSGLNQSIFGTTFNNAAAAAAAAAASLFTSNGNHQDVNNNGRINMNGVQLIPSRLPSGELALIMPNSTTLPSSLLMPNLSTQSIEFSSTFPRLSAFTKPTSTIASSISPNSSSLLNNLNGNNLINNNNNHLQQYNQHNHIKINNINSSINPLQMSGSGVTATTVTSPPLSPVSSISSLGDDSTIHTSATSDYGTKTPPLEQSITSDYFSTPPSSESIKLISRTGHLQQPHVSSTVLDESMKNQNDAKKRLRTSIDDKSEDEGNSSSKHFLDDSNDSMWRPW
ncbi:protein deadpan [Condylostylus longicornis]|uniref:protein deadpan n=1 Tax=Condylostylus longicornis TaxID=2530218 RepID=UPI00244E0729|nr:protein deadpan [Condylostylus longicornis]